MPDTLEQVVANLKQALALAVKLNEEQNEELGRLRHIVDMCEQDRQALAKERDWAIVQRDYERGQARGFRDDLEGTQRLLKEAYAQRDAALADVSRLSPKDLM